MATGNDDDDGNVATGDEVDNDGNGTMGDNDGNAMGDSAMGYDDGDYG